MLFVVHRQCMEYHKRPQRNNSHVRMAILCTETRSSRIEARLNSSLELARDSAPDAPFEKDVEFSTM